MGKTGTKGKKPKGTKRSPTKPITPDLPRTSDEFCDLYAHTINDIDEWKNYFWGAEERLGFLDMVWMSIHLQESGPLNRQDVYKMRSDEAARVMGFVKLYARMKAEGKIQ